MEPDPVTEPPIAKPRSVVIRRWSVVIVLAFAAAAVVIWFSSRDELPREIVICGAAEGGLYDSVAESLKRELERRTASSVRVERTSGSVENHAKLRSGAVHLALLQSGSVPAEEIRAIAPLYLEPVHVLARRGFGIDEITDLSGRVVAVGSEQSGMRQTSKVVVDHYALDTASFATEHFSALESGDFEGAIVTTGLLNSTLQKTLKSRDYKLLPILDAEAICIRNTAFTPATIPRGVFAEGPALPPNDVPTVAATAILAVSEAASPRLVEEVLAALYESPLRSAIPVLIPKHEAYPSTLVALDSAAQRYHDPYAGLGTLANLVETLSAFKELLFALGALAYLAWNGWRNFKERERARILQAQKDYLDTFLDETVRIEGEQVGVEDPEKLKALLGEVIDVKLRALRELSDEDLRGDQAFAIFMAQCSSLIEHLQMRITVCRSPDRGSPNGEPAPARRGRA